MPMEIHDDKVIMRAGKYNLPKPWVGLTDEEIEFIYADTGYNDIQMFARAIEAMLKERNS